MILLEGHSLTQSSIIGDERLQINLTERDSSARWTPADMTGIGINSWLKGQKGPGEGIVWRVQSIGQNYGEQTPTVQLEHVIKTLQDRILFGEITPATITQDEEATTCSAYDAVTYILANQSDWRLGSFSFGGVSNAYKFDGDTLYDALVKVTNTLQDAWWSYDTTEYPFVLNITEKTSEVGCELRTGRNLTSLNKTIDRSGMYTVFYPIGKDDLHITGDSVSRNTSIYGTICKVEVNQSLATEEELIAWANERLDRHAEPKVSVTADGLELAEATGESLDALTLGRICRIPLPEFNTTIEERIVEIEYTDAAHAPEVVRITMANSQEDVTQILADEIKNGGGPSGGGGRAAAKQNKRISLVVTDDAKLKTAEISIAINESTGDSEAKISADHIYLDGSTTVKDILTGIARAEYIKTLQLNIEDTYFILHGENARWRDITIDGTHYRLLGYPVQS